MATTIAGVYDSMSNAENAINDLRADGIELENIHVVSQDHAERKRLIDAAGLVGGQVPISALADFDTEGRVSSQVYELWQERADAGYKLVLVTVPADIARDAAFILQRHDPVEIE